MKANPTSCSTTGINVIASFVDTRRTNMSTIIRVHIAPGVMEIRTCQSGCNARFV